MSDLYLERMIEQEETSHVKQQPEPADITASADEVSTLEGALALVGDEKKYQKYLLIICCFIAFAVSVNFISVPFLFYQPTFMCWSESGKLEECIEEEACNSKFGFEVVSQKLSLTIIHKLYCDNGWVEKWAKSLLFVFVAISVFCTSIISDKVGRKTVILAFSIVFLVSSLIVATASSFWTVWLAFCSSFACGSSYFAVSSAYFNEVMGEVIRQAIQKHV